MEPMICFKTKGKFDLRSLTVFGLNAKPNTNNPIGYFGTGLKFAIAVLIRHDCEVTFHIDDKWWSVKAEKTAFRGKGFESIKLVRHRKLLGDQTRDLPFTTELGKNWELWQAFRELHSNTLDEGGETFDAMDEFAEPGYTKIYVRGQAFWNEYADRHTHFLPEALRSPINQQYQNEVQIFDRPSQYIYYRGVRIYDLPEETPSKYTYNILSQLILTEDRKADVYDVRRILQRFIVSSENPEFIRTVTSKEKSTFFEDGFDYKYLYTPPSSIFMDTVQDSNVAGAAAKSLVRTYRPPDRKSNPMTWIDEIIQAVELDEPYEVYRAIKNHETKFLQLLKARNNVETGKQVEQTETNDSVLEETHQGTVAGDSNDSGFISF